MLNNDRASHIIDTYQNSTTTYVDWTALVDSFFIVTAGIYVHINFDGISTFGTCILTMYRLFVHFGQNQLQRQILQIRSEVRCLHATHGHIVLISIEFDKNLAWTPCFIYFSDYIWCGECLESIKMEVTGRCFP